MDLDEDYEEGASSTHHNSGSGNESLGNSQSKRSNGDEHYTFTYNPESKTIEVFGPNGERVHAFDSITGANGKNGKSAYEDWAEHQSADKRSMQHYLDHIAGKPGTNGKSAYELWAESQPADQATLAHFFSALHGTNGVNGKSAYEDWAGHQSADKRSMQHYLDHIAGKPGTNGKSAYDLWAESQPTDQSTLAHFFSTLRGTDGVNGKSAFELWVEHQPGGVGTWAAYVASLKGTNGTNGTDGRDAYVIWAEQQPEDHRSREEYFNYLKGRNGIDGESAYQLWLRLYPHDGKVTEDEFFRWIAKQVPAQEGATFIPSIDAEGKLYFINSKTGEKTELHHKVTGENGKTYSPVLSDTYLWFVDEEGNLTGPKVDLKGKTGNEGAKGKSAYELWRDDPMHPENWNKPYEDFMETLKGLPGINAPEPRHSYLEVKDFVSPVQHIDPRMVVSSDELNDAGSAEDLIEKRLAEIRNIRKEGEKSHNHGSWIQEFFWWCAGVDRLLLRMCPGDHSKYMGIGTVIFFTALMAWFSSFIAMQLVFGEKDITAFGTFCIVGGFAVCASLVGLGYWLKKKPFNIRPGRLKLFATVAVILGIVAVIGGLLAGLSYNGGFSSIFATFWALMIFFLDRFITNTMYSDGKITISWLELRSALPRVIIAIFLGIIISAPLELIIFEKEIDSVLWNKFNSEIGTTIEYKIEEEEEIKLQLSNLNRVQAEFKSDSLVFAKIRAEYGDTTKFSKIQSFSSKTGGRTPIKVRNPETGEYEDRIAQNANENKPIRVFDQMAWERRKSSDSLKYEVSKENVRIADSLLADYRKREKDSLYEQDEFKVDTLVKYAGLYDRLQTLHGLAYQEEKEDGYRAWNIYSCDVEHLCYFWPFWTLGIFIILFLMTWPFLINVSPKEGDTKKENFKRGAVVIWPCIFVVSLICGFCNNTLFHALPYYIFSVVGMIMMLFILIDVSPVFYKMMLADGLYDKYLHQEKLLAQDAIRLNVAKTLVKVNHSDEGKLAPFIFGKTYEKLKKAVASVSKEDLKSMQDLSLDVDKTLKEEIEKENQETFEFVLDLKRRIVEASYLAWYRDMRDAMIGMNPASDDIKVGPEKPLTRHNNDGTPENDEPEVQTGSDDNGTSSTSQNVNENKSAEDYDNGKASAENADEPSHESDENVSDSSETSRDKSANSSDDEFEQATPDEDKPYKTE